MIRSAVVAALFSSAIVGFTSAFNLPGRWSALPGSVLKPATQARTLTFADRVAYQRAIEEVYWRHRDWPATDGSAKPSLDQVMPQAQIEKKVQDYLRNSQLLGDYWQRPITPEQLQAEMDRMARHSKKPEALRELFEALGNDPFVSAECLARPALSARLVTNLYAHDERFRGELKRRAEAELAAHHDVKQMKQTSGLYTEIEWAKSDEADPAPSDAPGVVATPLRGVGRKVPQARGYSERRNAPEAVKMNGSEWQESVEKLAGEFGNAKAALGTPRHSEAATADVVATALRRRAGGDQPDTDALAQIKAGVLSPLQEDDGHYYAVAVMKKGKDRLKLATVAWMKQPFDSWRAKAETQMPVTLAARITADYKLPVIGDPQVQCTEDTWTPTYLGAPEARYYHTAVWTGSEMIVWSGLAQFGFLNNGRRYDPATDSWTPTSTTNAPEGSYLHTAVWTGTTMIVWGGYGYPSGYLNTGGRYDPATDSWTATSTTNAPEARNSHTAVWTGSTMIVWGGFGNSGSLKTGGRYDPVTDSWTATNPTAPEARYNHTAVWTGSTMIVWGGFGNAGPLKTGGRYNPATNSWTATNTTAPEARSSHTAVWTGSTMIVWGGAGNIGLLNTGGRYDPATNSWTATSTTNAPEARSLHTAVLTGSEMIVWGGDGNSGTLNTGGRYNPATDSWTATSTTNAPEARDYHTAVSSGSEMIVWGGRGISSGYLNTGGRYDPATDSWTPTSTSSAPEARYLHTAVWTGSEMVVWGGAGNISGLLNTGGRYDPATDSWTATSTINAPEARYYHTAIWSGSTMIVWGGSGNSGFLDTGGGTTPLQTAGHQRIRLTRPRRATITPPSGPAVR